jgi:hypothetical protein
MLKKSGGQVQGKERGPRGTRAYLGVSEDSEWAVKMHCNCADTYSAFP